MMNRTNIDTPTESYLGFSVLLCYPASKWTTNHLFADELLELLSYNHPNMEAFLS